MTRRGATIASAAAFALIALVGAQSAGAVTVTHDESKSDFAAKISTTLSAYAGTHYSGKVKAEAPCRSDRKVQVRSAADNSVLATDQTNDEGKWSAATTFAGPVYFKVNRKFVQIESDEADDNPRTDKDDFVLCKKRILSTTSADLSIAKEFDGFEDTSGFVFNWRITVSNAGPETARNTFVIDTPTAIPPPQTFVSAQGASCADQGNGTVRCELGDLAPGQVVSFTIRFTTGNSFPTCINDATVGSSTPDPNSANNSAHADETNGSCD